MTEASAVLKLARDVADELLFPQALATDLADRVPAANLDALAEAGLYGMFVPEELGGIGAEFATVTGVIEILARGCLATTLVWVQHLGLQGALLTGAPEHLRDEWLAPLARGERRSGIALVGYRPGPALLVARPDGDDWILDGQTPWVSGWGMIDSMHLVARGPGEDTVVGFLFDAQDQPGLTVTRERLVAADASCTVRLDFDGVRVRGDRLIATSPRVSANLQFANGSSRLNASLTLGVAGRACRMIGPSPLDDELDRVRTDLDTAFDAGEDMDAARAAASAFAVRATAALSVHTGSASVEVGHHAQRLAREAALLLVFGTRPGIRSELLKRLGAA